MDIKIDSELEKIEFNSQDELDSHVNHILFLINSYEQDLYDKEEYSKCQQVRIRKWRQSLYKISQIKNYNDERVPEVLESTAMIINRQINKMDVNTNLLSKGTLKLMGLNYTNEDIDKALLLTKTKINEQKRMEDKEIRLVYGAFIIFVIVCMCVIVDKFYGLF